MLFDFFPSLFFFVFFMLSSEFFSCVVNFVITFAANFQKADAVKHHTKFSTYHR